MVKNRAKALEVAAAREKTKHDKAVILLRDLIMPFYSGFKNQSAVWKAKQLRTPEIYNVETLVEIVAAEIGGLQKTDVHHSDLSDGSEVKTASVNPNPSCKTTYNNYGGSVTNVGQVSSGNLKSGDLRVVVYIPHAPEGRKLRFFFLPYKFWVKRVVKRQSSYVLRFSYNKTRDYVPTFEGFEKESFADLVKTKATRLAH